MNGQDNSIEAGLSPSQRAAPLLTYRKEATTMVTTTTDRAEVFSRPAARFDDDGNMEVRASSALGCRRSLWYAATGYEPTNPPSEESLTAMEAGNALEPVVVRAMERAGLEGGRARPPGPEAGGGEGRPQHDRDRPPGRHGADAGGTGRSAPSTLPLRGRAGCPRLRRPDGRRDQDAGTGGVQALADAGSGAQPPGVGGPGRPLLARRVRRPAGRGDRHDGHGGSHLGLGADSRPPAGEGLAGRQRVAR